MTSYTGLNTEQSRRYDALHGQQWLSEDGMAPALTSEESGELAALERLKQKAAAKPAKRKR